MIRRPPRSPLFPYTPLSRSWGATDDTRLGRHAPPRPAMTFRARLLLGFGAVVLVPLTVFGLQVRVVMANRLDRKSTRLNSSHGYISYAVFCLKKKKQKIQ